jgi:plasmid stabilization system protein ParE
MRRIQGAVRRLARFPESGRHLPEHPDEPYREVIIGNYRVLYRYRPERNHVIVVAVVHGRRQLRLPVNGA